jgi:hypothetical protein
MGFAVVWLEELELFARGEIFALPTAIEAFLSGTPSYFAIRRAAVAPAIGQLSI